MRDPVMNLRTLNLLPTLEGARFQGPWEGVPGVLRFGTLSSDALGLLLISVEVGCPNQRRQTGGNRRGGLG